MYIIKGIIGKGPRGDYYNFIQFDDFGRILFGDEQGNYAGGIIKELNLDELHGHLRVDPVMLSEFEKIEPELKEWFEKKYKNKEKLVSDAKYNVLLNKAELTRFLFHNSFYYAEDRKCENCGEIKECFEIAISGGVYNACCEDCLLKLFLKVINNREEI